MPALSVRENVVSYSKNVQSHVFFLDFEKKRKKRLKNVDYVVSQAT